MGIPGWSDEDLVSVAHRTMFSTSEFKAVREARREIGISFSPEDCACFAGFLNYDLERAAQFLAALKKYRGLTVTRNPPTMWTPLQWEE